MDRDVAGLTWRRRDRRWAVPTVLSKSERRGSSPLVPAEPRIDHVVQHRPERVADPHEHEVLIVRGKLPLLEQNLPRRRALGGEVELVADRFVLAAHVDVEA